MKSSRINLLFRLEKIYLQESLVASLRSLYLPYHSTPSSLKKRGGEKPFAVCCLGCLNIHWSLAASEMIRNHWVVSGRGTMCLWPI